MPQHHCRLSLLQMTATADYQQLNKIQNTQLTTVLMNYMLFVTSYQPACEMWKQSQTTLYIRTYGIYILIHRVAYDVLLLLLLVFYSFSEYKTVVQMQIRINDQNSTKMLN